MNGRIDSRGWLHIERAGKYVTMECRPGGQDGGDGFVYCTHHCPLFGEPKMTHKMIGVDDLGMPKWEEGHGATVEICQGRTLDFSTFTDERVK